MKEGGREKAKQRAGESAANLVSDGMVVGLGTGSTAAHAIRRLAERFEAGLAVRGIPTSYQSEQLARESGLPLTSLADAAPDLAIDGADQIVNGTVIKGGGGAHTREKIVGSAADRLVVVVDSSKQASVLAKPVPVAVLPDGKSTVAEAIENLGGEPSVRAATEKDGPVVTDNGNIVIDCSFGQIETPEQLGTQLSAVPGVVEHGLFVDLVDEAHIGDPDGVDIRKFGDTHSV